MPQRIQLKPVRPESKEDELRRRTIQALSWIPRLDWLCSLCRIAENLARDAGPAAVEENTP